MTGAMSRRKGNQAEVAAYHRAYRVKNKEGLAAQKRKYEASHKAPPEIGVRRAQRQRARKLGNGVFDVTTKEMERMRNSPCVYCGAIGNIHIDHVVPVSKGGSHSIGNLQPLCQRCNQSKSANFYSVFKYRKAGLL